MGTDIHFFVEARESTQAPWLSVDKWTEEDGYKRVSYLDSFYSDRCYDLFSILAGVRNGYGFAGVSTGSGFVPMGEPRGWPKDLSEELAEQEIDHSASWWTLRDLMDYDWTQETTKSGVVSLQQWAEWMIWGRPKEWSGGISGPRIKIVEEQELARVMAEMKLDKYKVFREEGVRKAIGMNWFGMEIYTEVEWKVKYYEAGKNFLAGTVPRLWRLGEPENVRCLFFFDS